MYPPVALPLAKTLPTSELLHGGVPAFHCQNGKAWAGAPASVPPYVRHRGVLPPFLLV